MKQLFTTFAAVLLTTSVFAQSPEKMSYQAVVRDVNQSLITNQSVGIQISILQGSVTGVVVYSETQTPTTNINGLLSIEIGGGPGFDVIDWANGPYYLKTETDPTGGTNYTITGTSQLLSVPYALYAKTADSISGTITETDPIFGASVAAGITQTDTTYWNNKLDIEIDGDSTNELQYLSLVSDTIIFLVPGGGSVVLPPETDPIFGASIAAGITGSDTAYWNNKLDVETDPIFGASVAAGITQTDTAYWNNKLDVETDPIFGASVASGITSGDTAYWNNKLDSYTETDPIFGTSVAAGITGTDTTYWNNKLDVETDPVFGASIAAGIIATDTTNWNTAFAWGDHSAAGYFADGGEATGADRTLGNTDNYSLGLKTNDATRLHITNDGNVGVGIQSPSEKLSVSGVVESTTGGFKFPDGTVQTTAATASSILPPGMIVPFAGDAAHVPQGWLICDGSAISRTTYINLFNMIGTNYGSGNNSTTFNLPDLRGMFLRGADNGSGNDPDAGSRTASNPGGNTGDNVGSIQYFATSLPTNPFSANPAGIHRHSTSIMSAGTHTHSSSTTYGGGNHQHTVSAHTTWIMEGVFGNNRSVLTSGGTLYTNYTGTHSHAVYINPTGAHTHGVTVQLDGSHSHTISGGDSETRPVNVYVNYIIKY